MSTTAKTTISPLTFWINVLITSLFFPALIMLPAGDWRWLEGWLFALWFDAMAISSMIYMYRYDPALLMERAKRPGTDNQKSWDSLLLSLIYLLAIAWLILMPLDARRFGWSPDFPAYIKIIGGIALLPALYLIFRATTDNTFLSARVRVQDDRKQTVVTTGVYGFVRHPLYLGCILMLFGAPLLLGSIYGLTISIAGLLILIYRIIGEERMMVNELDGYPAYQQKVKYRLLPFIW